MGRNSAACGQCNRFDGTGVAGFARRLHLPSLRIVPDLNVWKGEATPDQLGTGVRKAASLFNVVADVLAGLPPAWHSGVSGNEAEGAHFGGPFTAVIASAGRSAVVVLPEVG